VRIWDVDRGVCLRVLEGRENRLRSAVFSLEGGLLASAGLDGLLKIWDVSDAIGTA
jgi:WD40 repeat protein